MKEPAARTWPAWVPVALHALLIWIVSSISNPDFVPVADVPFQDKGVHFLVYGVFALLFAHAALETWPRRPLLAVFVLALVVTVLWGALDEVHQSFVPGRDSDPLDVLADALGGLGGAALRLVPAALRRRARPA